MEGFSVVLFQEQIASNVLFQILFTDARPLYILFHFLPQTFDVLCIYGWVVKVKKAYAVIHLTVHVPFFVQGIKRRPAVTTNS